MAYVITDKCVACGTCLPVCPVEAISEGDIYHIDPDTCIECGSCAQRSNRSRRIINCTYYRNTKAESSTGGSAFTFHSVKRVTCSIIESLHVFCLNFFATWSDYAYLCRCKMPMKGRNITELLIYSLKYQQNNGKLQRSWLGQHP